jgi:hypothetical protein
MILEWHNISVVIVIEDDFTLPDLQFPFPGRSVYVNNLSRRNIRRCIKNDSWENRNYDASAEIKKDNKNRRKPIATKYDNIRVVDRENCRIIKEIQGLLNTIIVVPLYQGQMMSIVDELKERVALILLKEETLPGIPHGAQQIIEIPIIQ